MQGIRVGMQRIVLGIQRISLGTQKRELGIRGIMMRMHEIGGGNEGNQDEDLFIGVEMMNKKCGEGQK